MPNLLPCVLSEKDWGCKASKSALVRDRCRGGQQCPQVLRSLLRCSCCQPCQLQSPVPVTRNKEALASPGMPACSLRCDCYAACTIVAGMRQTHPTLEPCRGCPCCLECSYLTPTELVAGAVGSEQDRVAVSNALWCALLYAESVLTDLGIPPHALKAGLTPGAGGCCSRWDRWPWPRLTTSWLRIASQGHCQQRSWYRRPLSCEAHLHPDWVSGKPRSRTGQGLLEATQQSRVDTASAFQNHPLPGFLPARRCSLPALPPQGCWGPGAEPWCVRPFP